jgi:hypothetical protein
MMRFMVAPLKLIVSAYIANAQPLAADDGPDDEKGSRLSIACARAPYRQSPLGPGLVANLVETG